MPMDEPLYAVLVMATAGAGCAHEEGVTRKVLVIVQAHDEQEAHDQTLKALSHFGWVFAEIHRQAPVTAEMKEEPGYLGGAVRDAMGHGFQIVVYDQ